MMSAAFDAVNGEAVDIQTIVPVVGEEEELYTGGVVIMTLTDGGATGDTYFYTLAEDAPDGKTAGWYDDAGEFVVKTFFPGEGYAVSSDYEAGSLQTAGQVAAEDTIFALTTGINSCGNTTSATIDIDQIKAGVAVDAEGNLLPVNEAEEELYTGGIVLMTLTDGGATDETYFYTLAEDAPDGETAGWYDDAGVLAEKTFNAGIGFIISSDYEESYIKLPSAL